MGPPAGATGPCAADRSFRDSAKRYLDNTRLEALSENSTTAFSSRAGQCGEKAGPSSLSAAAREANAGRLASFLALLPAAPVQFRFRQPPSWYSANILGLIPIGTLHFASRITTTRPLLGSELPTSSICAVMARVAVMRGDTHPPTLTAWRKSIILWQTQKLRCLRLLRQ